MLRCLHWRVCGVVIDRLGEQDASSSAQGSKQGKGRDGVKQSDRAMSTSFHRTS